MGTDSLESGPSYVKSTLLTSSKYTNVTSGQNVVVNKQGDDAVILTTSMGTRCTLTQTDIAFQGGLVHVVDNLLIPPARLPDTTEAFRIPSFLGGLWAADLMPEIAERKNVTIFAPQNEALELVGGSLDDMNEETLKKIMGYHIVPNKVLVSSALTNTTILDTLTKDASLRIRVAGNNKYVNSAQIVQPDILIANGILHIISNVLNPEAEAVTPDPDIGTQPPVFPVSEAPDVFTSDLPCTTDCPTTTATSTPGEAAVTTTASSSADLSTSSSEDAAGPSRPTPTFAAAALGMLGLGAGMAFF